MAIEMRELIYLDNAATTMKKPQSVKTAVIKWCRCGNAGRGSHRAALAAAEKIYECRELAARLFGAKAENVVFTNNATTALNMAIKGFIPDNSHIITSDFEHNSVRRPVLKLCRDNGCRRDVFVSERQDMILRNVEKMINNETSALVCLHRSNITGRTMPIKKIGELCRRKGIAFIVDASQSAGNADIDIERDHIDILCLAGHKGLYGPQGTGLLIMRDGVNIKPLLEGGSGTDSKEEDMPDYYPDRLEAGTLSAMAIAGLGEGIRFVLRTGPKNIHKRERELVVRCRNALDNKKIRIYDDNCEGANLLFNIKGKTAAEVSAALDRQGICTRPGRHCAPDAHFSLGTQQDGAVRASFSCFTTEKEIDIFAREVIKLTK